MAHWITDSDGMFSVREKPWHGLGVILPDLTTAAEALQAASLDWTVNKFPVQFTDATGATQMVPRQYVTSRSDNNAPLGVVGDQYTPLQNVDAFSFFDKVVQDPGGPKYVTAGSLHRGRKVWILAKMPSFIEVTSEDVVQEYLLLSNTHDGTRKIEMLWTPIRVVCQNTLSMALSSNINKVALRHTRNFTSKFDDVRELLGIAKQNHEALQMGIDALMSKVISTEEIDEAFQKLIRPVGVGKESSKQSETMQQNILSLFHESPANTLANVEGRGWGLYNAFTEYADHDRTINQNSVSDAESRRVESNWFGRSAEFKEAAYDTLLEICSR